MKTMKEVFEALMKGEEVLLKSQDGLGCMNVILIDEELCYGQSRKRITMTEWSCDPQYYQIVE